MSVLFCICWGSNKEKAHYHSIEMKKSLKFNSFCFVPSLHSCIRNSYGVIMYLMLDKHDALGRVKFFDDSAILLPHHEHAFRYIQIFRSAYPKLTARDGTERGVRSLFLSFIPKCLFKSIILLDLSRLSFIHCLSHIAWHKHFVSILVMEIYKRNIHIIIML